MIEHVSLEPHAAIADWDANGRLTVWATIGRITLARADIARTLKLPMSRIRIIGTIVGGNFGGKNEITQEPALALLSKKDRPAGQGRVHARRGVHLDHHASPHHHGLQDRRDQ